MEPRERCGVKGKIEKRGDAALLQQCERFDTLGVSEGDSPDTKKARNHEKAS